MHHRRIHASGEPVDDAKKIQMAFRLDKRYIDKFSQVIPLTMTTTLSILSYYRVALCAAKTISEGHLCEGSILY